MYFYFHGRRIYMPICLVIVVILVFCGIIFTLLTPQSGKSYSEFKKITVDNGHSCIDINSKYSEGVSNNCKAKLNEQVSIEYIEAESYSCAYDLRDRIETQIKERSGDKGYTFSAFKYHRYLEEYNNMYTLIIQVDNTYIFSKVPIEYKNTVLNFAKLLGYY